jgi:Protein of unknown function (DUF2911)
MNRLVRIGLALSLGFFAGCPSASHVEPHDVVPPTEAGAEPPAAAPTSAIPERKSDADRKSKNGHLVHRIGEVNVDVRFGRPEARGRTLFGDVVPYGVVWRTGADEATTFSVDKDVLVNGQRLPAGVYALLAIPNQSGPWTVIFNKVAAQWGAFSYDAAQDALRVDATPAPAEAVEAMDIQGTPDGITLRWGTVSLPVTIAPAG